MKLITPEFAALFREYPLYSQDSKSDPLVLAQLFNPVGAATWWLTEYDPTEKIAFGYVVDLSPGQSEWGYISLDEMESIKLPFGLTIERDLYFTPKPFSECVPAAQNRRAS